MENIEKCELWQGDCLKLMKDIPNESIDCVIADVPYGTTACKWDSVIPFEPMWEQLNRVIKPNGAICLFADGGRFSAKLINSKIEWYRHKWVWNKNNSAGFALAKIRPFQVCEDIIVFGKRKVNYFPIMEKKGFCSRGGATKSSMCYGLTPTKNENDLFYPKNLLNYTKANNKKNCLHPTQKPVDLLEYLIKTYTNEGETVLDFTMGSGSTGVACMNTNRRFIGIELDEGYFNIAKQRIDEAVKGGANG